MLDSERFADKSPAQVYAILLDDGIYLASIRTMYRVMTLADQVRERRAQAAHPPRVRPELVADGPDQVWTWDITKLKGPWRGTYFDLYVMLDIFSRKAIRWEVHYGESGDLAKAFMQHAIIANGGAKPRYIHADNGTSMTSKNVATLLTDLNITRSHSRPHVSNDNPFSEAHSRPSSTAPSSPAPSPPWTTHAHSATCSSPTTTTSTAIPGSACTPRLGPRRHRLGHPGPPPAGPRQAFAARPDRFRRPPAAPALPAKVWINKPRPTIETQETVREIQPPDVSISLTGSGLAERAPTNWDSSFAACRNGSDYLADERPQPQESLPLKREPPQVSCQPVAQIQ